MANSLAERAAAAFSAALFRWRVERGLSKKQLAAEMGFDPSYISHVEAGRHRPTEDFARRAEAVLRAGGGIWQQFREYDEVRQTAAGSSLRHAGRESAALVPQVPTSVGPFIEKELATLSYVDGEYRCVVRRELYNGGTQPITRYLARIAVDRYPGEPERSNRYYRDHPLTWDELELRAFCGDEPMAWRAKSDRDSVKEAWLMFDNNEARFPLYPGRSATIEYCYRIGEDKWGTWFQRAVRLPTRHLVVRLDFPAQRRPVVWGVESSLTAEADPLRTPLVEHRDGARIVFEWAADDPTLGARFRFEWRLGAAG